MSKVRSATYVTVIVDGDPEQLSESAFNKQVETAKTNQTEPPEAVRRQTFTMYEAEVAGDSIDDILEVCPNPTVAVDLFNRGASLKQLNEIRDLMTSPISGEDAFETVEGAYDLKDIIARVTERKKLSPMDKVLRALGDLTDEEKQNIVARLLQAQSA